VRVDAQPDAGTDRRPGWLLLECDGTDLPMTVTRKQLEDVR
jgi:hypothetical protein